MKSYRKKESQPMTPWHSAFNLDGVSISEADLANGSPMSGDMIAINPASPADKWLVARKFFKDNYEEI